MIVLQFLVVILMLMSPYIFLFVFAWFGKWITAIGSVLTGDKEALKDCNLCEDSKPLPLPPVYGEQHWHNKWNKY